MIRLVGRFMDWVTGFGSAYCRDCRQITGTWDLFVAIEGLRCRWCVEEK